VIKTCKDLQLFVDILAVFLIYHRLYFCGLKVYVGGFCGIIVRLDFWGFWFFAVFDELYM